MISFPSARTLLAGLAVALCALTSLGNSAAADPTSSNYSYSGPSYGAAFNPPVIPTFNLNFTPLKAPAFRAPSYQGPVGYRGPARKAPTVNKTVTKQVVIHRGGRDGGGNGGGNGGGGTRVVHVSGPKVVEKTIVVVKPEPVTKTVKKRQYMVEELHAGRCIKSGPSHVYAKPSFLSKALGTVVATEKVHVNICLTDQHQNRQWCLLSNQKGIEAWIPASVLDLCPW